ncbi:hypothetical protein OUZ56_013585 [Daphnia magna]|uniref:Uncharacterized protein n=1 Tax=Daphnia magna TaxID=35525 RepID=A0ABQ9Z6B5_9CRUS|nr:hypothetical protein OUZ56_013585 [Daphnia magna]
MKTTRKKRMNRSRENKLRQLLCCPAQERVIEGDWLHDTTRSTQERTRSHNKTLKQIVEESSSFLIWTLMDI